MGNDILPTTIYINGVPISGVKEINLEPAHPTGDADMYKKQLIKDDPFNEKKVYREKIACYLRDMKMLLNYWHSKNARVILMDDIFRAFAKLQGIQLCRTDEDSRTVWRFKNHKGYFDTEATNDDLFRSTNEWVKGIACTLEEVEKFLELPHWEEEFPEEEHKRYADDGTPYYCWEFNYRPFKECVAVTQPAPEPKPEPKKVYLTTHNPYMSKDWIKRVEEIMEARTKTDPWSITVDTDVASMYPKFTPAQNKLEVKLDTQRLYDALKHELDIYSPSKALYEAGKLAAKTMNKSILKAHQDGLDAMCYSFDEYAKFAVEKQWEDYYYMIPPRCGKSAALGAIKLGERELEYCKQDVEETVRLYNAFKEKEESMKDYTGMSPREILDEMKSTLMLTKRAERYFDHDEWVWELSDDIHYKLGESIKEFRRYAPDASACIMGISVRRDHLRLNHIKLVRKVKEEDKNMTVHEKIKMIEAKLEKVAEDVNARVYTKYNGRKQTLEYVFVEKGTGYTFTNERDLEDLLGSLCDPLATGIYTLRSHVSKCFYAWQKQMNNTGHFLDYTLPQIDQVIFNNPATIVYWKDGTKTVVQARDEAFDPEKGLAMAISKKAMGNQRDYYIPFKKWLKKFEKQQEKIPHCDKCKYGNEPSSWGPCNNCLGAFEGKPNQFKPKKK